MGSGLLPIFVLFGDISFLAHQVYGTDVDIIIGEAKIIGISLKDKSGHMWNYCKFYDFKY